jgi:hypothetical protein
MRTRFKRRKFFKGRAVRVARSKRRADRKIEDRNMLVRGDWWDES